MHHVLLRNPLPNQKSKIQNSPPLFSKKNICAKIQPMALRFFPCLFHAPRSSFSAPAPHSFRKRLKKSDFYSFSQLAPLFTPSPLIPSSPSPLISTLSSLFSSYSFIPQKRTFVSLPNMTFTWKFRIVPPDIGGNYSFLLSFYEYVAHLKN